MTYNPLRILLGILLLLSLGCAQSPRDTGSPIGSAQLSDSQQHRYFSALDQAARGELADAVAHLESLSQVQPGHPGIWLNLTALYLQKEATEQAAEALEHAQALAPDNAATKNLQGTLALAQGDPESARDYYRAAIARDQHLADAHYNLALVYDSYYQDIPAAISHYQAYLELLPEDDPGTRQWLQTLEQSRP